MCWAGLVFSFFFLFSKRLENDTEEQPGSDVNGMGPKERELASTKNFLFFLQFLNYQYLLYHPLFPPL